MNRPISKNCHSCGAEMQGDFCPVCDKDSDELPTIAMDSAVAKTGQGIENPHIPKKIGPYRILETLGEGGMGIVYLAEQREPIRRKVALKVIKPGMDSKEVLARFEAERQAVALMDHPCIAKVFDAGTTEAGLPFFVMEWVEGKPVTTYCDEARLSLRERLRLFQQICEAVQHAHQKGIIHRDIKPSNILVAKDEKRGRIPKVIDFGVAKALGPGLTEQTLFTAAGQIIGTPQYMSPEQANFGAHDVDTRSDIYSLGILLYELLTGRTPLEASGLEGAGLDAMLRKVREEEVPRPSTKLSALAEETRTLVAATRQLTSSKLAHSLGGDLDWIVVKALQKERQRRYETANAFSLDLENFLADQPVSATPPSATYRFSKFARRNRGTLVVVSLASFSLIAGILATMAQTRKTNIERSAAEKTRGAAEVLLSTMLYELDASLSRIGRIDLLEEVSVASESYFESGAVGDELPQTAFLRGRTYLNRASVLSSLGKSEESLDYAKQALEIGQNLLTQTDQEEKATDLILSAHEQFNSIFFNRRDYESIELWAESQVEMIEKRLERPEPTARDFELATNAYLNSSFSAHDGGEELNKAEELLGRAMEISSENAYHYSLQSYICLRKATLESDLATEVEFLEQAIVSRNRALELAGDDYAPYRRRLAWCLMRSGWTIPELGRRLSRPEMVETGHQRTSEALRIYRDLVANSPRDLSLRYHFLIALFNNGNILAQEGKREEAYSLWNESFTEMETLCEADPSWSLPLEVGLNHSRVLGDRVRLGKKYDPEKILQQVVRPIRCYDLVTEKVKKSLVITQLYFSTLDHIVHFQNQAGIEKINLEPRLKSQIEQWDSNSDAEPVRTETSETLRNYWLVCGALAAIEESRDNRTTALFWITKAESYCRNLDAETADTIPPYRAHKSVSSSVMRSIGKTFTTYGEDASALRCMKTAAEWQEQLCESTEANKLKNQEDLAKDFRSIADLSRSSADLDGAVLALGRSAEVYKKIVKEGGIRNIPPLIWALSAAAEIEQKREHTESAQRMYQSLAETAEELSEELPGEHVSLVRGYLAASHENLGRICETQSEWEKAEAHFRRSLSVFNEEGLIHSKTAGKLFASRLEMRLANLYGKTGRWNDPQRQQWFENVVAHLSPLEDNQNLPNAFQWVLDSARRGMEKD